MNGVRVQAKWFSCWRILPRDCKKDSPKQWSLSLAHLRFWILLSWNYVICSPFYAVELRYVELYTLELFLAPFSYPGYLALYYVPKKQWSKSVRKCSHGTSWQDLLKAECIDVFTVTKANSDWLDLPLRMQVTSCRYLLILGNKLLLHKFDTNLTFSNPHYLKLLYFLKPLRVRDSGDLLYSSCMVCDQVFEQYLLSVPEPGYVQFKVKRAWLRFKLFLLDTAEILFSPVWSTWFWFRATILDKSPWDSLKIWHVFANRSVFDALEGRVCAKWRPPSPLVSVAPKKCTFSPLIQHWEGGGRNRRGAIFSEKVQVSQHFCPGL